MTDEKKPRQAAAFSFGRGPSGSGKDANVRGLQALLALLDFEFDALVFGERLEAGTGDVAEVGEQVGAARVLRDEAEALALVEPLHGAGLGRGRHGKKSNLWQMNAQHMRRMQRHSRTDQGDFKRPPRGPRG